MGTQEDKPGREWKDRPKHKGMAGRQTRRHEPKCDGERKISSEVAESILSRKAAIAPYVPVPQTDTGRRGENPQTDGRSVVKELGKMTP